MVTASLHGHLLTVRCPACRQAFPIDRDHLGAETACPRPACGRSLRINPFLPFDISDATGAERATLSGHTGQVLGCAVSPDGAWIVSASADRTLRIWDAATGVERAVLAGHTDSVLDCAVSPDGAWIVSAGNDKTLRIWDVATGAQRAVLAGHTGPVYGCAVSPDGAWIVSAGYDKTLRIWDAATGVDADHPQRPR